MHGLSRHCDARETARLASRLAMISPSAAVPGEDKAWKLVGELVSIEGGDDKPIRLAKVRVTVREFSRSGTTDDQGLFVIEMPAAAGPGQEVALRHDKDHYEVFFPYRGRLTLPAAATPPAVVEVRMLPKGSKRWWTDAFIDVHIEHERSKSAQPLTGGVGGRYDPEASLRELAAYTGFPEDEARRQLTGYIENARTNATNRDRLANAEFLARNYRLAGELYLEVAGDLKSAGGEIVRLAAYKEAAAGDSFYNDLDFAKALATYEVAGGTLDAYRTLRETLGLGDYPESVADRRSLAFRAANARVGLAIRIEGPAITRHLNEAIDAYRRILDEVTHSGHPEVWAMTQDNLGAALGELAGRSEGRGPPSC